MIQNGVNSFEENSNEYNHCFFSQKLLFINNFINPEERLSIKNVTLRYLSFGIRDCRARHEITSEWNLYYDNLPSQY